MLSDNELGALREVAESAMVTPVTILRLTTSQGLEGDVSSYAAVATVLGNLYSEPAPVLSEIGGVQAIVNTYRLFVPVGTDIRVADHVMIGSKTFTVSDTNVETTWTTQLRCSLRSVD